MANQSTGRDPEIERRTPTETANTTPMEAGESITCEAKHVVATANQTVSPGKDDGWMEKMTWHQPKPKNGDVPGCTVCGRLWLLSYMWPTDHLPLFWKRTWLCVEGQWSSPLTPAARDYLDAYRPKETDNA